VYCIVLVYLVYEVIGREIYKYIHNVKLKKAKIGRRFRNDCFSCQV